MRVLIIVAMVMFSFSIPLWAEEGRRCTTSIIVHTCGDAPVESRKVKITLRDGDRHKDVTDAEGRIEITSCVQDIATIKISGADPLKTNRITVQDSTDDTDFATITLNICDA